MKFIMLMALVLAIMLSMCAIYFAAQWLKRRSNMRAVLVLSLFSVIVALIMIASKTG